MRGGRVAHGGWPGAATAGRHPSGQPGAAWRRQGAAVMKATRRAALIMPSHRRPPAPTAPSPGLKQGAPWSLLHWLYHFTSICLFQASNIAPIYTLPRSLAVLLADPPQLVRWRTGAGPLVVRSVYVACCACRATTMWGMACQPLPPPPFPGCPVIGAVPPTVVSGVAFGQQACTLDACGHQPPLGWAGGPAALCVLWQVL